MANMKLAALQAELYGKPFDRVLTCAGEQARRIAGMESWTPEFRVFQLAAHLRPDVVGPADFASRLWNAIVKGYFAFRHGITGDELEVLGADRTFTLLLADIDAAKRGMRFQPPVDLELKDWAGPRSPSEWAKQFDMSLSTFSRMRKRGVFRTFAITPHRILVHPDDARLWTVK